jgi:hypothetical protein
MVSAIERTIDQRRQPGMKRTCVRSPDRFQITNIVYALATGFSKEIPGRGPRRAPAGNHRT